MPKLVFDNYFLEYSDKQWIINFKGRPYKFFQKLENAVLWIFNDKIGCSEAKTIPQLIEAIKRAENGLCSAITSFEKEIGGILIL